MNKSICFVAGHSGGHIIPAATLAKHELEKNKNLNIIFFSTNNDLDRKILHNFVFIENKIFLSFSNLPKKIYLYPKFFINFILSFFKSFKILKKNRPLKIISVGGLISIPICLAGKLLNIPIEIYELNVEPGKAINFLSKFTKKINVTYKESKRYFPKNECNFVEYPVRFTQRDKINQKDILNKIGFSTNFKTILIIGGSQGSKFINNLIKNFVEIEKNKNQFQIIHQTGSIDKSDWKNFYLKNNIEAIVFDYTNEIQNYYSAADVIICRSGAGTLAEILFFNKKCITIPLETKTTNHQILNALAMQKEYPDLFCVLKQNEIEKNNYLFFEKMKNV